jgi:hypothetical protein
MTVVVPSAILQISPKPAALGGRYDQFRWGP